MSPALPVVSGADVVHVLTKAGFVRVSLRWSHVKARTATRVAIVPIHHELAQDSQLDPSSVRPDS